MSCGLSFSVALVPAQQTFLLIILGTESVLKKFWAPNAMVLWSNIWLQISVLFRTLALTSIKYCLYALRTCLVQGRKVLGYYHTCVTIECLIMD
jgi:hypothetical protein